MSKTAIVIGSGIVSIATTLVLLDKGYQVRIIERNSTSMGASVRNFGMIWPIGQPKGIYLELANKSKSIWEKMSKIAGFHFNNNGSLHLAYDQEEKNVLLEFIESESKDRNIQWLSAPETLEISKGTNKSNLAGSMWSGSECLVDPREAVAKLILYLEQHPNCEMIFGVPILNISDNICYSIGKNYTADKIFICTGGEMNILFPELFNKKGVPCELQMMRTGKQPNNFKLGPSLCAGLTLLHYKAFAKLNALTELKAKMESEKEFFIRNGIHVMAAQNHLGEVTIGDSHKYGNINDPFIDQDINDHIIDYLKTFCLMPDMNIRSYWKGVYLKSRTDDLYCIETINPHCNWINCFGGAGMTLSFGVLDYEIDNLI